MHNNSSSKHYLHFVWRTDASTGSRRSEQERSRSRVASDTRSRLNSIFSHQHSYSNGLLPTEKARTVWLAASSAKLASSSTKPAPVPSRALWEKGGKKLERVLRSLPLTSNTSARRQLTTLGRQEQREKQYRLC